LDPAQTARPEPAMPSYRRISCTFDLPPPVFSRRGTLRMDVSPDGSPTRRESIVVMPRRKEDVLARMRSLRGEQPGYDVIRSGGFQADVAVMEHKLLNSARASIVDDLAGDQENRPNRPIGNNENVVSSSAKVDKPARIRLRDVFGDSSNVSSIDDRKEAPSCHPKNTNNDEPDERRSTIIAPPRKPSSKRSLPSLRSAATTQTPKSLSQKFSFSSLSRAFRWGRASNSDHTAVDREGSTSRIKMGVVGGGDDRTFQSNREVFACPTGDSVDEFGRAEWNATGLARD
jgi:hypothetical protein